VDSIQLVPATSYPELLAAPLQWSLDLWGEGKAEFTAEDWRNFYSRVLDADYENWDHESKDKELLYLAMPEDETAILGVIALCDFDDLEEFRHLKPWFCAFVVREDLRGQGLGRQILAEMENIASKFRIETVYLWTEDQINFYQRRGYEKFGELAKPNRLLHIFRKTLAV
jgi:N-acetylglutamate synthase-like GNAT family acetyltransferase